MTPKDPAAASAPVSRRAACATVPGGPAVAPRNAAAGGKTPHPAGSPTPLPGEVSTSPLPAVHGAGMLPPETGAPLPLREVAPVRGQALSGAEWRAAAKRAQSKGRRTTATPTAKTAPLPPVTGGAALTATADCLGRCDWTAGPGDPGEVDKAADTHTTKPPKHPTNVVSEVAA